MIRHELKMHQKNSEPGFQNMPHSSTNLAKKPTGDCGILKWQNHSRMHTGTTEVSPTEENEKKLFQ